MRGNYALSEPVLPPRPLNRRAIRPDGFGTPAAFGEHASPAREAHANSASRSRATNASSNECECAGARLKWRAEAMGPATPTTVLPLRAPKGDGGVSVSGGGGPARRRRPAPFARRALNDAAEGLGVCLVLFRVCVSSTGKR